MTPRRPHSHSRRSWRIVVAAYLCILIGCSGYVLLDTFVIPRAYVTAADASVSQTSGSTDAADATDTADTTDATVTDSSYVDGDLSVTLTTQRYEGTTVYVVDIVCDDPTQILAAFAGDTYGRNITDTTSDIASAHDAVVAINGDYYGARNSGYVVRNGVLYRDEAASSDQEDLVIYKDGTFEVVQEGDVGAQELVDAGAWQVLSFGPGLVEDGEVSVSESDEVDQAKTSNPRTAIGKVSDGHYVLVVSDGRTSESAGLTLYQLATYLHDELGVTCAYNLDGGGSSTLYLNGEVANNPTTDGSTITERSVSDIVYLTS